MHPWRDCRDGRPQGLGCPAVIPTIPFQLTYSVCAESRAWRMIVDYHKLTQVVDSSCSCSATCGFIA